MIIFRDLLSAAKRRLRDSLRVAELPLDEWRTRAGLLSGADVLGVRARATVVGATRLARSMMAVPALALRLPQHLVRLALELEELHFGPMRRVHQGRGCVVDRQTWLTNGQNIFLGDYVKVSAFSAVLAGRVASIRIGTNTIIGPNCTIVSFNHGFASRDIPIRYQDWHDVPEGSIEIGEDVWIGAHALILPGSRIGNGAVIGGGVTLTGEVAPYTRVSPEPRLITRPRRGAER